MSLTTRLSFFFLTALGVVLIGFSASLYYLAAGYLQQQVEDRLTAALNNMEATIDRETEGLYWDPDELHDWFGRETGPDAVRWQVASGIEPLDRSANLDGADLGLLDLKVVAQSERGDLKIERAGKTWQAAWRRLRAPVDSTRKPDGQRPHHSTLLLTVGLSLEPMHAALTRLGIVLMGLSSAVWFTAAVAGRWFCRRALAPLAQMADAARNMQAADLGRRLPDPRTPDELGELHQAFNDLLDRLQDAFERQRRFTGDASHQLRTPLTAMLGQVEVALRRERPADDYRHVLTLVHQQGHHLRRIVEALLFLGGIL